MKQNGLNGFLAIKNPSQKAITGLMVINVTASNPNGDPDTGGKPRVDASSFGIISAESVKRKLRDLIADPEVMAEAREALGLSEKNGYEILESHASKGQKGENRKALSELEDASFCQRFVDVRLFGCTLLNEKQSDDGEEDGEDQESSKKSKGKGKKKSEEQEGKGKVFRGGFQFRHGQSVSMVDIISQTLTQKTGMLGKDRGMAPEALSVVGHGIYLLPFSYAPHVGLKAGVTDDDIRLIVWLLDKTYLACSVNRVGVEVYKVFLGVHNSKLGSFNRYDFVNNVSPFRKDGNDIPSHSIADYTFPDFDKAVAGMEGSFFQL